ncbi:TIR domain-containing protein [bacterium]|nr:TIR domain-containing protein [bacterium]MBU1072099.1 TIR domain-containing protein [bacterium]MBU1674342.1 TIR domain-containing protein [bacterium]
MTGDPKRPLIVGIGACGKRVLQELRAAGHDEDILLHVGSDSAGSSHPLSGHEESQLRLRLDGRTVLIAVLDLGESVGRGIACKLAYLAGARKIEALFVAKEAPETTAPVAAACDTLRNKSSAFMRLAEGGDPTDAVAALLAIMSPDTINADAEDVLAAMGHKGIWNLHAAVSTGPDRAEEAARGLFAETKGVAWNESGTVLVSIEAADLRLQDVQRIEAIVREKTGDQTTVLIASTTNSRADPGLKVSLLRGPASATSSMSDIPADEAMATAFDPGIIGRGDTNALTGSSRPLSRVITPSRLEFEYTVAPIDPASPKTGEMASAPDDDTHGVSDEDVDCTVYAYPFMRRGDSTPIQVWAHKSGQTVHVAEMAREMNEAAKRLGFAGLDAPVRRGQRLTFELTAPGAEVDEPVQSLIWRGRPYPVAFKLDLPDDFAGDALLGWVRMACDGVPCGRVLFRIGVSSRELSAEEQRLESKTSQRLTRYERAFISYATPDRNEVLKRVQMLASMKIEYFQDVLSLDPGVRWERELYRHIDESDLFLLFWSSAAKASEWVRREVLYALDLKKDVEENPPDILPVILEGPPVPEPPPELSDIHFNDRLIYFIDA